MTRTNFLKGLSSFRLIHQTGAQRKRVSIGENEKRFIVECYNLCHGKDWKEVLLFSCKAKSLQRVIGAGLPGRVVRMYLEQSVDRFTGRMRNIIKNALRSAQPATQPTTSTVLDETPALIGRQTKYSKLMTPRQRKAEAVKRKLDNELVDLLLDSSEGENGKQEKKRKIDHARRSTTCPSKNVSESHGHHEQGERLVDKSEYLLRQVQEIKKKEAMFLLRIYSSRAVLSYLTGLFKVCLSHFNLNTKI